MYYTVALSDTNSPLTALSRTIATRTSSKRSQRPVVASTSPFQVRFIVLRSLLLCLLDHSKPMVALASPISRSLPLFAAALSLHVAFLLYPQHLFQGALLCIAQ